MFIPLFTFITFATIYILNNEHGLITCCNFRQHFLMFFGQKAYNMLAFPVIAVIK